MAWIEMILEDEAGGDLAELYSRVVEPGTSVVDNVLKVHSLHPAGLAAHFALYRAAMSGTAGLKRVDRELIAVVVSDLNGCHY